MVHDRSHEIEDLAGRAFDIWDSAVESVADAVVQPSVPILYFGDMDAFLASPIRIATVALNPSRVEFPSEDPFKRFPQAEDSDDISSYLKALNAYFVVSPYRTWFASFEPLLNGMDASYYPGGTNSAVHTDLCSPVATDPTWSRLDRGAKSHLMKSGVQLWHHLVAAIQPHVLLISVAREHLAAIEFDRHGEPAEVDRLTENRVRPYVTETWKVDIDNGRLCHVAFGRAANQPFGLVTSEYKKLLGRKLIDLLGS